MLRKAAACLLLLFASFRMLAIEAVVGHTVFYQANPDRGGKLWPYAETYWQIKPNTIHYTTTPEKKIIARIKTDIIFLTDTGILAQDHFILQTTPRENMQELMRHRILELRKYFVAPGKVKMKFHMTDMADTTNRFSFTDSFNVNPVPNATFFSNIQLLDTIIETDAETAFLKNGRQQVPAVTNFLDEDRSVLHYYIELYRMALTPPSDRPLIRKVLIAKYENEGPYMNFIKTDTITERSSSIISGLFDIRPLSSGNYYLQAILENKFHNVVATETYFFQRLNKHPLVAEPDTMQKAATTAPDTAAENVTIINLKKTFVAKYSLAQVKAILKMLLPFSDAAGTRAITAFLKKPDELYMRYYVYNYFTNINKKDPGKAWKDFSQKITEANKLYSSHGVNGYETDRGFIYLRYGAPTEVVTVENETGSLPYEIWQYNTLTTMDHKDLPDVFFLFYKPNQMMGDYKILHSTVPGEPQNLAWRSFLYVNPGDNSNSNTRAEQYIGNK